MSRTQTGLPGIPRLLARAGWRLLAIVLANAALQALIVVPSPAGLGVVALACGIASLVVLVVAGMLAARALGASLPPARHDGRALERAGQTIRAHPWRFALAILGTIVAGLAGWLIGLITTAFLPGPLAVLVAWIGIGLIACVPFAVWVRLARRV